MARWCWITIDYSSLKRANELKLAFSCGRCSACIAGAAGICELSCTFIFACACEILTPWCVCIQILCLLGCQPKSREVTGPDRKIDRPTGSWTRDGFGSTNWTVKALKPFKRSQTEHYFHLRYVKAPVCIDACDCACGFFFSVIYFIITLTTLLSIRAHHKV